jgi:hypothetical protein
VRERKRKSNQLGYSLPCNDKQGLEQPQEQRREQLQRQEQPQEQLQRQEQQQEVERGQMLLGEFPIVFSSKCPPTP